MNSKHPIAASTAFIIYILAGHPAHAASHELHVTNDGGWGATCTVIVDASYRCIDTMCLIPLPRAEDIQVHLSCLQSAAPTGFENPPAEVLVQSVRAKNVRGFTSTVSASPVPPSGPSMELSFCLFGAVKNLCGSAGAIRKMAGTQAAAGRAMKKFLQTLEWQDAPATP